MAKHAETDEGRSASTAYETRDVKVRPLVVFLAGMVVLLVAAYLIVLGIFRLFNAQKLAEDATADPVAVERAALPPDRRLPAEPRIQADPAGDYQALRRAEDQILEGYGWIDRAGGVVHIPIERAMTLVVEEGLPARQREEAK